MKIHYWDESPTGNISTVSAERSVKIGEFKNCYFTGVSLNYPYPLMRTGDELLLPTIERFMSLGRGTVYEDSMEYNTDAMRPTKTEKVPVFYFVYNCANYFHWLYDTMPYLYSYFITKNKVADLKLLISPPEGKDDLHTFVYETLELLGIGKSDIIFLRDDVTYDTVYLGSSLTHNRMSLDPPHPYLYELVNRMDGTESSTEKIYISRRTWTKDKNENIGTDYTQERMCVNEDEVVEFFVSRGFKEVFCEDMSMRDKVGLFRNAHAVAGPIGGGMSNVLFCSPDTKVISINSPEFFDINKRLGYALNHTELHMFDDTEFVDRRESDLKSNSLSVSGGMNSHWKVNMRSLKNKVIKELL